MYTVKYVDLDGNHATAKIKGNLDDVADFLTNNADPYSTASIRRDGKLVREVMKDADSIIWS